MIFHFSISIFEKSARGKYGDTIEELDWSMGELLKCLKKNKICDNMLKKSSAKSKREIFFFYQGSRLFAVRQGQYKLHLREVVKRGKDPIFLEKPILFDLGADLEERLSLRR